MWAKRVKQLKISRWQILTEKRLINIYRKSIICQALHCVYFVIYPQDWQLNIIPFIQIRKLNSECLNDLPNMQWWSIVILLELGNISNSKEHERHLANRWSDVINELNCWCASAFKIRLAFKAIISKSNLSPQTWLILSTLWNSSNLKWQYTLKESNRFGWYTPKESKRFGVL